MGGAAAAAAAGACQRQQQQNDAAAAAGARAIRSCACAASVCASGVHVRAHAAIGASAQPSSP
eukprot:45302-Prymnesium_polylepis.1